PDDPLVGLLPPDKNPPAGSGTVTFSVKPRAGLAGGAQVSNQAEVVFGQKAPINTPAWTNTLAVIGPLGGGGAPRRRPAQEGGPVLPSSRSIEVGATATAFVTVINAGVPTATAVTLSPQGGLPGTFVYQTTDPATNAVSGTPNAPVDIPAGKNQTYVIAFTPSPPFPPPL